MDLQVQAQFNAASTQQQYVPNTNNPLAHLVHATQQQQKLQLLHAQHVVTQQAQQVALHQLVQQQQGQAQRMPLPQVGGTWP